MTFIRLGELPPLLRSHDPRWGRLLPGVCVFRAHRTGDRLGVRYTMILDLPMLKLCFSYLWLARRRTAFEVQGELIGYGPDREPLLAGPSVVRTIPRPEIVPLPFEQFVWEDLLRVQDVPEEHRRWQARARHLLPEDVEAAWRTLWHSPNHR